MTEEIKHVTEEQWAVVDKLVTELMHEPYILPDFPHMTYQKGAKTVKYPKAVDVKIGVYGDKFDYSIYNVPNRKWNSKPVVRRTIPILIDHQDNDLSSQLGVQSLLVQEELEANKEMYDNISEIIFHGKPDEVPGSEGMVNFTGISSNSAAGTWTTAQDLLKDLETAISSLRTAHILPPYSLILTPGVPAEMRASTIANIGNEWKEFLEIYMNFSGQVQTPVIIDKLYVTDAITTDGSGNKVTLSTSTQCFVLFKNDPNILYIAETEGISRKNTVDRKFEEDITYVKIWGGCFIPKNVDGIYLCYSGDTTTAY